MITIIIFLFFIFLAVILFSYYEASDIIKQHAPDFMSQIDWALGAGWEGGNGTALTLIKSRAPTRGFTAEIESKWVRALKPGVASWRGWSRQVHSAVDNSRNLWRLRGWKEISREHARTVKRHLNSHDLQCSLPYPHPLLVPGVVSTWTVRPATPVCLELRSMKQP